jgi:hypothetical protein
MSNFCAVCGASIGGGKFCPKCGNPQGAAPSRPAQAAFAPAKRGSPTIKAVFIILACMLALGVAGTVGALYWAKGKVEELAHSTNASSFREAISSAAKSQPTQAGCDLISKERVAQIIGAPVARAEGNDAGEVKEFCNYWSEKTPPGEDSKKISGDSHDSSLKDAPATLKDLQDLANSISASAHGHNPLLGVQVFRGTAKLALISLKTANLFSGQKQRSIDGPWDEAYFGPYDSLLFVRKGDNGFMLDLKRVPQPREKGVELANVLVSGI